MLPAELMGLNSAKFKQLNNLVKSQRFINYSTANFSWEHFFYKTKKI